ncbi:MAG: UDP-N-acetylglucosamine--LPS N-acetylglucosamine transferase [Candidatus Chisholmbacteria bacterium RIFCSPHIGHO2_01_FULL_49_18]|uniref:UDP-N-acetylglucosamine--LPS N-acetylglucosamine transferase n=1 Tax=Candidatus Chisholmbacteria bacterium RIFCSPHIGHO2_01_FULL_49_18 TaxID=1797590 RepID=A0A1G1VL10_9BACT|nr:MAG: UDP-N-acetylglucosamine--LPS N-acetylglucosamine transferase [Candidatus Chisholmbacteria bacterium RIFCSPHIGHO2_01_FULL_49_18]
MSKKKICLVTSSGGHLFKVYCLKQWWVSYERFWVTRRDQFSLSILKGEKTYFAFFPENRNFINFVRNLFFAYSLLRKEKPDIVFSTGAGIAPPFMIIAKLLNIKTIFLETFILIPKATISGRLLYPIVDLFLVQNKNLLKTYPKAQYWGSVL